MILLPINESLLLGGQPAGNAQAAGTNEFSKRVKTYTFTNNSTATSSTEVPHDHGISWASPRRSIIGYSPPSETMEKLFLYQVLRDCNFLVQVNLSNNENIEGDARAQGRRRWRC